jgi:pimeloyl-ACP methyl ester carboxylesterase
MNKFNPTIVLVHGAWADASSWNKVIPLLRAEGFTAVAVQIPLTSVEDDSAATSRIIADVEGPIVLVGHSWGGMAITQAGDDAKVAALVYVSAFAPDVGETGSGLIGAHPAPPALSTAVTDKAGFVYQSLDGVLQNMAPDIPVADAQTVAVTQGRLAGKAFMESVTVAAWKSKPSWFVVTAEDRVVSVELQAAEAERMAAKKIVLHSSHMSLLSHPKEVAAVIKDAVSTVASRSAMTDIPH